MQLLRGGEEIAVLHVAVIFIFLVIGTSKPNFSQTKSPHDTHKYSSESLYNFLQYAINLTEIHQV